MSPPSPKRRRRPGLDRRHHYTGGLGVIAGSRRRTSLTPAPLTAIAADGWQATYDGTPPGTVIESWFDDITRAGFDATGAATTYHDRIYVTKRVRQPYPNHASLTTDTVALSELIYSTDVVAGVTNNSTKVSPKPIANWALPDRKVVGNSISGEIVAAHYNGRNGSQVACIEVRATDGTDTVTTLVSATVVSSRSSDQNAVLVYPWTLDITSLDPGVITVNARVIPWIGESASILDSADQSARREFSPRYYLKDVTRFSSPPCAYVTSAGNDGTGVWSTTAATAEASPFLTVQGAINAAAAQMPAGDYLAGTGTSRPIDGAIIRVGSGTFTLASAASSRPQKLGAVIITRDPNVAKASAIVAYGTATWRARLGVGSLEAVTTEGAVIFSDITISRTGTSAFQGEAANQLDVIMDDVSWNNGNNNATTMNQSHVRVYGAVVTNAATSPSFLGAGTYEWRCKRGFSVVAGTNAIEAWLVLGSNIEAPSILSRGTRTASGAFIAYNKFRKITYTGNVLSQGSDENITGLSIMQNLFEGIGAGLTSVMRISGDSNTGNLTHVVHLHNTYIGFNDQGRWNFAYNETPGDVFRAHTYIRSAADIAVQINSKHDVFIDDGDYIQSWEYLYGVGCVGEFSMFRDAGGGGVDGFGQDYPGLLASIGTSNTVRNDPLFTNYQGTTSGPTAGAGNGDYTISSSSPAKERVSVGFLSHDLAGTARGTPVLDTASTYEPSGAYTL
jgi:hypothetical protein